MKNSKFYKLDGNLCWALGFSVLDTGVHTSVTLHFFKFFFIIPFIYFLFGTGFPTKDATLATTYNFSN